MSTISIDYQTQLEHDNSSLKVENVIFGRLYVSVCVCERTIESIECEKWRFSVRVRDGQSLNMIYVL